jgi:hypothetical protein
MKDDLTIALNNMLKKDNSYGIRLIHPYRLVPIDDIGINKQYQRNLEPKRLNYLKNSIEQNGFLPHERLILNQEFQTIDGMHRYKACEILGTIEELPCTIYSFSSLQHEAKFFSAFNQYSTRLKPGDLWYARYLSGDPLANLLENLEQDPSSEFYKMIALKGRYSKMQKFTIPESLLILSSVVFNYVDVWHNQNDHLFIKKIESLSYDQIRITTNNFLRLFYEIFGEKKMLNPLAYRTNSIHAFVRFYNRLVTLQWIQSEKEKKHFIRVMKRFPMDITYNLMPKDAKYTALFLHYQKSRKEKTYDEFMKKTA